MLRRISSTPSCELRSPEQLNLCEYRIDGDAAGVCPDALMRFQHDRLYLGDDVDIVLWDEQYGSFR